VVNFESRVAESPHKGCEVLLWLLREQQGAAMLSTVGVWLALRRDWGGLAILGAFLSLLMLAVIVWSLIP
jgi:hypothetical protein